MNKHTGIKRTMKTRNIRIVLSGTLELQEKIPSHTNLFHMKL